ncbi:apolipoprotein N-acyltransferase [Mesobacterium pallidum]|uniref:apolipoprotein N-acyltransferase n=1 Tax=Mesobacterium pallidum TaxID=2872037 RepID=UPI001EE395D2|nr:apolipoprotein N-acyltransferase [Mesobacterium pallidum]
MPLRLPERRRARIGLAGLAGAGLGLGMAPFGLWPLTLVGIGIAGLLFASAPTWRVAARDGWAVASASYLVSMHWIVEPFLVDIARHGWMAPFALIFLAAGLALFWGAAFGLAHRLTLSLFQKYSRGVAHGDGGSAPFAPLSALATLTLCLGGAEWVRGHIFTGFPWNLPSQIWLDLPAAQLASTFGAYGLTTLTFALVLLPLGLALSGHARMAAATGFVALAAATLTPVPPAPATAPDAPRVRLVQPNAPQHQKWDPAFMPVFFNRLVEASAASPRPDLIVWPETAAPGLLNTTQEALAYAADMAGGVPIVTGAPRVDAAGNYLNSVVVLDAGGAPVTTYDKHHLVPFGEYLPLGDLLRRFGLSAMADLYGGGFTAGPGPRLIDAGPVADVLPLICYEAVFPRDVSRAPARPRVLLHLTNDAWFGNFSGPYQHLAQSRMRAIEQGLPLLRAANTGVSAAIDARGQVIASLALNTDGHLDVALPTARPPTPYARWGDLASLPLLAALVLLALATGHRRARP